MQLYGYQEHGRHSEICRLIMKNGGTVHQRFIRWQRKGIWKKSFEIFKGNKKLERLMINPTYIKDRQHLCGGAEEIELYQGQKVA